MLKALVVGDINVKLRNKLYAAMKRIMSGVEAGKHYVPGAVCARYAEAVKKGKSRTSQDMFFLLKEFVVDPTCLSIKFEERHVREWVKYSCQEYVWVTRTECIIRFQGHVWEPGRLHAEKVLSLSKSSKPHPMAPKDPELRLFKILSSSIEGEAKKETSSQSLSAVGEVSCPEAAQSLMAAMGSKGMPVTDDPDGGADTKEKKTRAKKEDNKNVGGKPKGKSKGKVKGKAAAGTTEEDCTHARLTEYRLQARRLSAKLRTCSDSRLDVACCENLDSHVSELLKLGASLEDAELAASQDTAGIQEVRKTIVDSIASGNLRMLKDDLEFAQNRVGRFAK